MFLDKDIGVVQYQLCMMKMENPHKIPKKMLPVKLPEININLNVKGNPLDKLKDWKKIIIDGKKYTRETDTLRYICLIHLGIF